MSLSKEEVLRALSILKDIIAEAESLEAVNGDELGILQSTADRLESPLFQTLVEVQRQQQEEVDCLMLDRSSIGDTTNPTPADAFMDQPHQHHNVLTNREAGGGSNDSANEDEDEISPDNINPVICNQDTSTRTMHGTVLPLNSSKGPELFDTGNHPHSHLRLTSSREQTPPLSVGQSSHSTTVVLMEGMSHSSLPRVDKKECSSFDGPDAKSQQKTGVPFDLLSPMREEKSLLAIKAAVHNRKSRTVTVVQSAEGLGLDIVGLTRVGLFVNGVQKGGVAEGSGQIQRGDQVMEVNGMSCENLASFELTHKIKEFPVGKEITFTLQYNPSGLAEYLRQYS